MSGEVIFDMTFDAYCAVKAMNISSLCWMDKSPAHFRAAMDGLLRKDSVDLALGRAIHARCLEPEVYEGSYRVSDGCRAILKTGRRKGQHCGLEARYRDPFSAGYLCGKHASDEVEIDPFVLTEDEHDRIEGIAEALSKHEVVKLLKRRGGFEATLRWTREEVDCKARLDKLIPAGDGMPAIVADLKKSRLGRGSDHYFEKDLTDYLYDAKAAWYVDAVEEVTGDRPVFIWLVVEDVAPYAINAIQADRATLAIGRMKYQRFFADYKRCMETNEWPGYSTGVKLGGSPAWEREKWKAVLGADVVSRS